MWDAPYDGALVSSTLRDVLYITAKSLLTR